MLNDYTELPTLRDPPIITDVTSSTVDVKWTEWTEGIDAGDSPLVAYIIYLMPSSGEWREAKTVSSTFSSSTVRGLGADTDYEFSVGAVRQGEGGAGPRSAATAVLTKCLSMSHVGLNFPVFLGFNVETLSLPIGYGL